MNQGQSIVSQSPAACRAEERRRVPACVAENGSLPVHGERVGRYPGPVGSHTASAAAALFPSARLVPLAGFRAVADAVTSMDAAHGVLPIESSLAGPVAETHDLLYERALSIVAETVLPIRHCLAGPADVALEDVRVVRSHPTALDQCRDLLARMPQATASRRRRRPRRRRRRPRTATRRTSRSSSAEAVVAVRPDGARRRRRRPHRRSRASSRSRRITRARRPARCARTAFSFVTRAPAGRAARGDRAVRARRARSRCGSSRGRCRRRRGSTASTPSSRGIRSIRRCGSAA